MTELKFDADAMFNDIVDQVLVPSANQAIESIYKYIVRGLVSNQDVQKRTITPVEIEKAQFDEIANKITAACVSYGWSILVSYGTGVNMDKSNQELSEYINSNLWNPLRARVAGARIKGRSKGSYQSVIGARISSGKKAGEDISGWRTLRSGIKPNYAIQNAELRLDAGLKENGFVHRILETNLEKFFNQTDLDQYFIEVKT